MTNKEFIKFFEETTIKMVEVVKIKNHDYSCSNKDPFANFKVVENCNIASTEQGFLTRMMDKISRINSFVKQGVLKVEDEKIEDTLLDLANYSIFMAAYIKSKKEVDLKDIY